MGRKTDKPPRKKQFTHELMGERDDAGGRAGRGGDDESRFGAKGFVRRGRQVAQQKMAETALLRAGGAAALDIETLPVGEVTQVFSLYCRVAHPTGERVCVVRKTLTKLADTAIVVGDRVRFRDGAAGNEPVIEQVLPRKTLLTRAPAHGERDQPIVANADQMLIVAAIREPRVKWGLIDRMIVAALAGGLTPIVCLNKSDLLQPDDSTAEMDHYAAMNIRVCRTSIETGAGLDELRDLLRGKTTVLAGHSGVGKSSLISAIQPGLDIRIGRVSEQTEKGRHTTTSARRYDLAIGGCVIDTPGVKLFGLAGVSREKLLECFPDVAAGNAPPWRRESYQRIADSLPV
jgi:ribosome biogenesis GTPase / thiamine phosphate phosphatase